ncbi:large-conductance mechanosensitive channel protein MscL [Fulvivirga sp. RKSG066]|uniref:large-conductance mechanosensitive channel protein MscL n=1 Tax=Fulvivirga aurantia TaxID=2529383 RepID=UPI0012BCC52E|nr:large-conductance mechanosensitive channel protein MscL [Fulvivirga aurantia]MTI22444.1 large-conductance mechanosensitive channel protein MscL [Fulvivirga aurantia]
MKNLYKEFKEFAVRGSVVDLAIGVVIGTAFNKIVTSLVNDVIMPPFGLLWGGKGFSQYKLVLRDAEIGDAGKVLQEEVAISYGQFATTILDFLIITLSIFLVLRFINTLRRKAEDEKEESVPTPKDIQLLAEIRDLLKQKK